MAWFTYEKEPRPGAKRQRRVFSCKLNAEQQQQVAEAYRNGESSPSIAKRFGVSKPTILKLLRRLKVTLRLSADVNRERCQQFGLSKKKFDHETEQRILNDYREIGNAAVVAERFGCTTIVIYRIAREAGVPIVPYAEVRRNKMVKHDFFSTIQTEEQAYWLGMMAADGYVGKRGVSLSLEAKDADHVSAFANALGYDGAICITPASVKTDRHGVVWNKGEQHRLYVSSKQLPSDLANHGVTRRKTHTLEPWSSDRFDLQVAYWRGYIDGDGTINSTTDNRGRTEWTVGASGTVPVLRAFVEFVQANTSSPWAAKNKKITPCNGTFIVNFCGTYLPRQIVELLYGNATVYLSRKKAAADRLIAAVSVKL